MVPDTRHKTQKSENDFGGFWAAPEGFPEVECTVALSDASTISP